LAHLSYSVTVTMPKSSSGKNTLKEEESAIFERNWQTTVGLELMNHKTGEKRVVQTTQGRLYSFLRTGNFDILEKSSPTPVLPILVVAANKKLEEIQQAIVPLVSVGMEKPNLFIMAFDMTNPGSRAKPDAIRACLKQDEFPVTEKVISPKELGVADWETYAPTINFLVFCVDTGACEKLRDSLKRALYKPVKNKKTKRENFKLRKHGLFVPARQVHYGELVTKSFAHGEGHFYRYRLDTRKLRKAPAELQRFCESILTDCAPDAYFKQQPTCSGLHLDIGIEVKRERLHQITDLAGASFKYQKYKSTHENLQTYFLEMDECTIASEIPLWMDASEYDDFAKIFSGGGMLTGHIDLLRLEADEKIGVWDFKPAAFQENYAAGQVYMYAVMLSLRANVALERILCGYFDASDAFIFEPAKVDLGKVERRLI